MVVVYSDVDGMSMVADANLTAAESERWYTDSDCSSKHWFRRDFER